jgi:hypothetical protein
MALVGERANMFLKSPKVIEWMERCSPCSVTPHVLPLFHRRRFDAQSVQEDRMRRVSFAAAILSVAGLYAVPASNVYAQSQLQQQPGLSEPAPGVSDQKLDAAAAAIKQVIGIKNVYEQRIESTVEQTDRERIADEAKTALEKAVTDQGLSVPEFKSILVMAQNNPEVQEKIRQRVRASGK